CSVQEIAIPPYSAPPASPAASPESDPELPFPFHLRPAQTSGPSHPRTAPAIGSVVSADPPSAAPAQTRPQFSAPRPGLPGSVRIALSTRLTDTVPAHPACPASPAPANSNHSARAKVAANLSGCDPPDCSAARAIRSTGPSCNTQIAAPRPALAPTPPAILRSVNRSVWNSQASAENILCALVRQTKCSSSPSNILF